MNPQSPKSPSQGVTDGIARSIKNFWKFKNERNGLWDFRIRRISLPATLFPEYPMARLSWICQSLSALSKNSYSFWSDSSKTKPEENRFVRIGFLEICVDETVFSTEESKESATKCIVKSPNPVNTATAVIIFSYWRFQVALFFGRWGLHDSCPFTSQGIAALWDRYTLFSTHSF